MAILVLGMHRSGTSALTRVLSLLGADLPSNLMPAAERNNETGFWESLDAYRLNDEILASADSSWDDWRRFDPDRIRPGERDAFETRALKILEQDYAASSLFVLKDPRVCRLLPFWLEVLRAFDAEPKPILPIRNPIEVAASLKKRDGFSPAKSHMLWLRHVLDAEHGTRGRPRALVAYDALLDDWRSAVTDLSAKAGIDWPRRSVTAELEIDGFLERRHRHHVTADKEVFDHPEIAVWVKEAYAALIDLREHPESAEALGRLDSVRQEFDRASDALGAVARSGERERSASTGDESVAEMTKKLESERQQKEEMRRIKNQLAQRLNGIHMSATWQLSRPIFAAESRWPNLMRGIAALPKLAWWAVRLRLPGRLRLARQAKELLDTGLFDLPWYVEQNPDLVLHGINPVMHWLVAGWKEGRNPNPWFDTVRYLKNTPALSSSDINPLVHYLSTQGAEARKRLLKSSD